MRRMLVDGRALIGAMAIWGLALLAVLAADTPEHTRAGGADITVSVSSASAATNSQTTVNLVVTPESGITVGALRVVVTYDGALLTPSSCGGGQGVCNVALAPFQVGFAFASLSGVLNGVIGTITFNTGPSVGISNLTVNLTTCADEQGIDLPCTNTNGTITITNPTPTQHPITPTPSPSPAPTPAPTPTAIPTATPVPTASPVPLRWGDVNCDGNVNSVDALAILRKTAGLPVFQVQPCPIIGSVIQK